MRPLLMLAIALPLLSGCLDPEPDAPRSPSPSPNFAAPGTVPDCPPVSRANASHWMPPLAPFFLQTPEQAAAAFSAAVHDPITTLVQSRNNESVWNTASGGMLVVGGHDGRTESINYRATHDPFGTSIPGVEHNLTALLRTFGIGPYVPEPWKVVEYDYRGERALSGRRTQNISGVFFGTDTSNFALAEGASILNVWPAYDLANVRVAVNETWASQAANARLACDPHGGGFGDSMRPSLVRFGDSLAYQFMFASGQPWDPRICCAPQFRVVIDVQTGAVLESFAMGEG